MDQTSSLDGAGMLMTRHPATEGLRARPGAAVPALALLPQGTPNFPEAVEEQARGNLGLGGLFYSLLWSIQKQLTEIIKSSIPEPHSSNSPSISSRSIKPSALEPLFKKKSLGKEKRGRKHTTHQKEGKRVKMCNRDQYKDTVPNAGVTSLLLLLGQAVTQSQLPNG